MDKTFSSLPDRSKISEPRHNIFSFIFRFLQYPIRPALKSKILDIEQVNQKLNRIAWEIYEENLHENEIVVVGVSKRGLI